MAARLLDFAAISASQTPWVLAMTKDEVRELLDRLDDMPEHFDDFIGTLDDAMAAATDAEPGLIVLRIAASMHT
nr:hypothetical protein [uncultured Rhodopila sp.]